MINFYKRELEQKAFIKQLTDNPELLWMFSNERLKIILEYYKKENEKRMKLNS